MAKREEGNVRWIAMIDLVVLLVNLHLAAQDPKIGHGDPDRSLREITRSLVRSRGKDVRKFQIRKEVLESCLWAANMMQETGKFWSPYTNKDSMKFKDLLKNVLNSNEKYEKFYSQIREKRPHGKPNTDS